MITFAIPTLNRPSALEKAVCSLIKQTRLPDELIIVDQSSNNESKKIITRLLKNYPQIKLKYILDSKISGLVEARRVSFRNSIGSLILYGEDDFIYEKEYCEQIENGFKNFPKMLGCCGMITNPPKQPFYYNFFFPSIPYRYL